LWGAKRASLSVAGFLALGFTTLPAFSMGRALFPFGPTSGYLIGMFFSAAWIGFLADHGATKRFTTAFFSAWSGSAIVFTFGLLNLSLYVPRETLFSVGVLPFLPGDLIKTTLAALIAVQAVKHNRFAKK
jgi:biotin transport system substrate-specific component